MQHKLPLGLSAFGLTTLFAMACASAEPATYTELATTLNASSTAPTLGVETKLLQEPTIARGNIVFRYADDLWVVSTEGGEARRLTSSPGTEYAPQLSPDGQWVAFSGQYEGNTDVYVMSIEGGLPRQLTYHPGRDTVVDWMPDGSGVIFTSSREMAAPAPKAFVAALDGGLPTPLELPKVSHLSINAKGSHFAYTPVRDAFRSWKRYRGGRTVPVWIFDRETLDVEVVPHVNASDTFPVWAAGDVFFASDRDGVMNVYRYTPGSDAVVQVTNYTDFDVRNMDAGGGQIVFEQAGTLHVLDPKANTISDLTVTMQHDGLHLVPRWVSADDWIRNVDIAPNGKRLVFEARGELITAPKEHGSPRHLTNSPGAHDRSPVWSPDGKTIAWFSDASGEYQLMLGDDRGATEPRAIDLGDGGFYSEPQWSPDGEKLLFLDKKNRIAYVDIESGAVTQVDVSQGSLGEMRPTAVWSPDSQWIAYERRNPRTMFDQIHIYSVADGTSTRLTDDFAFTQSPAFSSNGKYLYFGASTDVGPKLMGLNMAAASARDSNSSLYVCVLAADEVDPLGPRSDEAFDEADDEADDEAEDKAEDKPDADEGEDAEAGEGADGDADSDADAVAEDEEPAKPSIDLEGLDQRILALPAGSGRYGNLLGVGDKLLFIDWSERALMEFDFDERKSSELRGGVNGFTVSGDGKSLLLSVGGGFEITGLNGKGGERVSIANVRLRVEPEAEWPQILREAWRIERDYFYDPQFHGVDWDAMWTRWSAFLPHVRHRSELNLLLSELLGELATGHEYVSGGDFPDGPDGVSVGLLGADWEVDGERYRVARVLEGQNWNPGQRAPLTAPGVQVEAGDYLIAVNGREVTTAMNLYAAFTNTAGRVTTLTFAKDAAGSKARDVDVEPISSDFGLRRATWVEDNRKRVDELSNGRLAYVYMPNTGGQGMTAFDRDFYSQLDREGLVLDERYNGGGMVADYVIEALEREIMNFWINREGWVGFTPSTVFDGPKVMIINESAGSGGDWMPWAFQKRGIGPLVGTRTWGGLVGISGYPPLMDGGSVTAASFGIVDTDGQWIVENVGVSPDYEVIEFPKAIIQGGDPQLEKAVQLALDALESYEPTPVPSYTPPTPR